MEELKALIQQVDDDYLIGLSNKGTVKRAYKDLEAQTFHHTYNESNIEVTLKDETCTICKPLGESKCTCPSKSICRHRITAILWMKKILEDFSETDSKTEITSTIETNQHIQKSKDADTNDAIRITDTDVEITKKKLQKDLTNNKPERKGDFEVTEENTSPKQTKKKVFKEILEVPLEKLKRACGITKYRQFLSYVRLGEQILIQESSIITVSFSWDNVIVKLLEPLVYSTCTCHSKELCTHKAQAILAYQLQKEVVTIEQLEQALQEEKSLDEVLIRKSAMQICNAICHQMLTGLSRQSQEITEELERLAVIAHRAEIASLENQLRQCITFYQQYFSKNALFRSETLFQKLLQIYKKADVLQIVQKEQMRQLVGTFRDTYELTKDLHLMGIGSRAFQSKSGYEGETYYFLEINQKKWYTWTDARPIFYEDVRQRQMYTIERTIAPWGLGCTREKMIELEFILKNAKTTEQKRLSSSQDIKSEVIGTRTLQKKAFEDMIIWDYENLIQQYEQVQQEYQEYKEILVLVGAVRWSETFFDKIEQQFTWRLFDIYGNTLVLSIDYTKEEKEIIEMLEHLEKRLRRKKNESILFFGSLYLDKKGQLCLYPIEFLQIREHPMKEKTILNHHFEDDSKETQGINVLELTSSHKDMEDTFEKADLEKQFQNRVSFDILQVFGQYQKEVSMQLNDIFVSGLYSVQPATIKALQQLAEEGEQLGLHQLGKELSNIVALLEKKRHTIQFDLKPLLKIIAYVENYLFLYGRKIAMEKARLTMKSEITEVDA